jgi:hypothetical protein
MHICTRTRYLVTVLDASSLIHRIVGGDRPRVAEEPHSGHLGRGLFPEGTLAVDMVDHRQHLPIAAR